jgi:hypothetical protein
MRAATATITRKDSLSTVTMAVGSLRQR